MVYSYYDYLEKYYEEYYASYYEYYYWPQYYGIVTFENQTYICGNNTLNQTVTNTTVAANIESNQAVINGTLCDIFNGTFPPSEYEYIHPWNLDYITPPLFSTSVLCAVIAIIIVTIFFRKLYAAIKKKDKQKPFVTILTSFAMLCHLGYAIVDPIMYYFWWMGYDQSSAINTEIAWEVWWLSTKLSLYSVYIYRYYMIFTGAKFVSKTKKFLIFGGFFFVMIIQMSLFITYIVAYVDWLYDWTDENARRLYLNMSWAFVTIDFIFVFAICFLLNRTILQIVIGTEKSAEGKLAKYIETDEKSVVSSPSIQSLPSLNPGISNASSSKIEKHMAKQANKKRKINLRKNDLMYASTKIALLCLIGMLSSFCVQVLWLIQEEIHHGILEWISYIWCIDNVINMLCIHLVLAQGKTDYNTICKKCCKLHQCCLFWMIKIVAIQTNQKHSQLLLTYQTSIYSQTSHSSKSKDNTKDNTNDGSKLDSIDTNVIHIKITEMGTQIADENASKVEISQQENAENINK